VFERNKGAFEVKVLGIATSISDVFSREDCQEFSLWASSGLHRPLSSEQEDVEE